MYLAIPFTLLLGSYVAAAPSIHHAQVSVKVTNMDAYDQVDASHSSEELLMNAGGRGLKSLPFNFTLSGRHATGPSLLFGIEDLNAPDGFGRGELGFRTEFALRNGKLINGNRALGYHAARIFPPWTALSSLKGELHSFPELIAIPQHAGGRPNFFLEFETSGKLRFGWLLLSYFFPFIHSMVRRR